MRKDKAAQLTIRDLNKLTVAEHKELLAWLRGVIRDVQARKEEYAPVVNWSLMER